MIGYYIHQLSPFLFEFKPGFGPRWYGLSYVLAFFLGYKLYHWLAQRGYTEMPAAQVADFITSTAIFGVMLGGRLGWALFYGWPQVVENPLSLLEVWKGGMSSHGGMLGVVLFTLFWSRRHRIPWTSIGDSICVVAPIGFFIVRCANFINGELFGKPAGLPGQPASVPWAVIFPQELSEIPALDAIRHDPELRRWLIETLPPRHPSQIYEALLEGVVLFALTWFMRTRIRMPRGMITGVFFLLYALLRIVGEIFREPDPAWAVGSLSAGQFLSLFLLILSAAFIFWSARTRQYEPAFTKSATPPR